MNQTKQIKKKCSVVGHDNLVQFACFNEACKANRVYCFDCLRNGDHAAHPQNQKELKKFLEFCNSIAQESESLITKLLLEFGKINDSLTQLNLGLRKKYKLTNKGIFKLDAKQLNQVLDQFVKYNGFTKNLLQDIEKCSNDIVNQLNKYTKELKLHSNFQLIDNQEFNYYELTKQQREQAEQLYQQGYKLYLILESIQSYIKMMPNMKKQQKHLITHCLLIRIIYYHYIQKLIVQSQLIL